MDKEYRTIEKYISIVSHEIKNSLNPVINLSALMLKSKNGEKNSDEREYLETIERNGRRILAIIENLSFINRMKNDRDPGATSRFSFNAIVENSVASVSDFSGKPGLFPVCVNENGEPEISGDSELLKKILSCITGFYLSFRDVSSLYYRIKIADGLICVNVSDTGSDVTYCPQEGGVFNRFDISILSETSLLWYSFAGEMICLAGGIKDIVSRDGSDITWIFTLPAVSAGAVYSCEDESSGMNIPGRFTLMIVDDDPDTMIPLQAVIEYEFGGSCELVYARNGGECIDLLGKIRPDVILLDLSLPDISGFSLIRSIKNFFVRDDVPVIAFTGHDISRSREKILSAGFSDIITKPFDIDEFTGKIRKWKRRDD